VEEIARFARQILEALRALRSKGIVCDHLSTGNVVIDDQENARIAEIYTPLLAIDRHRHVRELTVPLEAANVDIDILLFGHVLYEMATGATLTTPAPDDAVLEQLSPEIADVLDWIFYPDSSARKEDIDSSITFGGGSTTTSHDDDDAESVSTRTSTSRKGGAIFRTDLDELTGFPLFADADVPPIDSLFSGFRLDSSMKTTVRRSMRVNASRNHAYVVQYKDAMALVRAKQRAERRVYDEKEKNDKRAQHQLLVSRGVADESATTGELARRKSYRAHRFKAPLMRQTSSASSSTTA
jgi:serine/threonine protein kinase